MNIVPYIYMERLLTTKQRLKQFSPAQRNLYTVILESHPYAAELSGRQGKMAAVLEEAGIIYTEVDEQNRVFATIPQIKFIVKTYSRRFNVALERVYQTGVLIAPDFFTAFHHACSKWKSLLLGVELYDISAES